MRKLFTLVVMLLSIPGTRLLGQSCCMPPDMKLLAMNANFKAAHPAPLPFSFAAKGSMIQFATLDGKNGNAYYLPSDAPTNKVLLIFHEWWGLNDYIKQEADNWQKMLGNVDVYAVDLYDGKVATDPTTAGQLAHDLDTKRAETIIKGLLSKVGEDRTIATLGWCMGGSWSFTAARFAGAQTAACVMYYGFPEQDEKKVKQIKSDVLYIWGSQDEYIKKPFVDEFGERIKSTGHKFEFHAFDAPHAFANPSNPKHNALATTEAQNIALKFLKDHLQLD